MGNEEHERGEGGLGGREQSERKRICVSSWRPSVPPYAFIITIHNLNTCTIIHRQQQFKPPPPHYSTRISSRIAQDGDADVCTANGVAEEKRKKVLMKEDEAAAAAAAAA
jgi:hypothetical protein